MTEKALAVVTTEHLALVKSVVFPDSTDAELKLFLYECARRGVHPLDRKIFPIKRNDSESGTKKLTFQCSIDYFRSAGLESGEYDGQDEPEFGPVSDQGFPEWATVKIYRKGIDRPFVGTARWKEYYPGEKQGFMWRKMPHGQLAKCAEALAFRKAFPQALGGMYTDDEMLQADAHQAGHATTSLKESVKEAGSPSPAPQTESRSVKDMLKSELAAREPNETARAELLKSLSVFGRKGSEKWITSIDAASDKWCEKVLENLRKLSPKAQQQTPAGVAKGPEDCTLDPSTCAHSKWVSDAPVVCGSTGKDCPFTIPAE